MLKKVRANTNGNSFTSMSEITKTIIAQGREGRQNEKDLNKKKGENILIIKEKKELKEQTERPFHDSSRFSNYTFTLEKIRNYETVCR